MGNTKEYVDWFRGAAPYIKAHQKKTFVILISDDVIYSERFIGLVHDIALLNHLGIRLVLLHSSRKSIDAHLCEHQLTSKFHHGIRISDANSLPFILQAINQVKTHFESHLSMGLPNTPMSGSDICLLSGNFVTGMPLGVIDGIDMQHSGKLRDIKHREIQRLLDSNHIILMSNIGYSRTGEVFNLPAEELACEVASSLSADKLIFIKSDIAENESHPTLSTQDCLTLIEDGDFSSAYKDLLRLAMRAIDAKVARVHLIDQNIDGGLLIELFTRDGYGTMITDSFYEGLRAADIADVGGILSLIQPLENSGVLVERSREQLELEIAHFQVIEKDGMIIACIACIPDQKHGLAEIACLAVHHDYQGAGLGSQLLEMAIKRTSKDKITQLFTLTTRTTHWFIEHGFVESKDFELPENKLAIIDPQRRSKIFIKVL